MDADGCLVLTRARSSRAKESIAKRADPIMLEVFNNSFMHVAEEMGTVLESTAHSVNIKERLDFSCAVFDARGGLIANAPHMPVHLGSMGDSVQTILRGLSRRARARQLVHVEHAVQRRDALAGYHGRDAGIRSDERA